MNKIKHGTTVDLILEGKSEDGTLWFKNDKDSPLTLVVGEGKLLTSLEHELVDMTAGESKTITLSPENGFGQHHESLVMKVPRKSFNPDFTPEIGARVAIDFSDDKHLVGTILESTDEILTIDFNHPLAGKTVLFTFTVISIKNE
jgi:FKBP-type peptidyl-prolyl cis-trans isomerase 2